MAKTDYVYHYTDLSRWKKIKKQGYLKLTPSNLKNLVKPRLGIRNGKITIVDETDNYKPVVWLTDSETAYDMGLSIAKMQVQIAIPFDNTKHHWWWTWKDKNKADKEITKSITCHGEKYRTWYVCEEIIPLEDFAYVKDLTTDTIICEK